MPSEAASKEAPSSFAEDTSAWRDIELAVDQSLPDQPLAQTWIAAARSTPALANLLLQTHRASSGSDEDPLAALARFARRPRWLELSRSLAELRACRTEGDEVALAHLAAAVARQSGWTSAEKAFWQVLTKSAAAPECWHAAELVLFDPSERCRIVGRWLLEAARGSDADAPRPRIVHQVSTALDSLLEAFDPGAILAEIETIRRLPCRRLDDASARRLASLARWAAYRLHTRWHEALHRVIAARRVDDLMEEVASLLDDWVDGRWGVWIALDERKEGVARWIHPGPERRMLGFAGSREELETSLLPPRFRSSRELLAEDHAVVGCVYSDGSMDLDRNGEWFDRLAAATRVYVERTARVREADRSLHRRQSAVEEVVQRHRRSLRRAIGEFSAGAGHEINNPLGAIAGHAARLLRDEQDPERRRALKQITAQTDRIRRMIRDLQAIGGERRRVDEVVELGDVLADAAREAEKRLSGGRRTFEACEPGWRVRGERALLVRMLAELVVNGAEAAGPEGHVHVRVERSRDPSNAFEVLVRDSGPGLRTFERHHAFTPFYSGREAGRGLGMGLPLAQRIAEDHGGRICIAYTRPSTVRVLLPAA
jgi:signal transduction histidine kinase